MPYSLGELAAVVGLTVGLVAAILGCLTAYRSRSEVRGPWLPWAAVVTAVLLLMSHRAAQFIQAEWFLLLCDISVVVASVLLPVGLFYANRRTASHAAGVEGP